jgi:hypothetical protein
MIELLMEQIKTLEAEFQLAGERVFKLTDFSRKDVGEVMLSYLEELGELCQEIKIATGVAGTQHKSAGPDGIYGECADVWICAVSHCYAKNKEKDQVGIAITAVSPKQFTDYLIDSTQSRGMQSMAMGLALYVDPDPICFLNKINSKLDKWVKNVKYID